MGFNETRYKIGEFYDKIETKDDFIEYLMLLSRLFQQSIEEKNNDVKNELSEYLFATARFLNDIEGLFLNFPEKKFDLEDVNWKAFAQILMGGISYD